MFILPLLLCPKFFSGVGVCDGMLLGIFNIRGTLPRQKDMMFMLIVSSTQFFLYTPQGVIFMFGSMIFLQRHASPDYLQIGYVFWYVSSFCQFSLLPSESVSVTAHG